MQTLLASLTRSSLQVMLVRNVTLVQLLSQSFHRKEGKSSLGSSLTSPLSLLRRPWNRTGTAEPEPQQPNRAEPNRTGTEPHGNLGNRPGRRFLCFALLCFASGLRCGQAPHPAHVAHPLHHFVGGARLCKGVCGLSVRLVLMPPWRQVHMKHETTCHGIPTSQCAPAKD